MVRRQDFCLPPFDSWLFARGRFALAREMECPARLKPDSLASLSRFAQPVRSRVPRERGSGRQELIRVQAQARLAELTGFSGRSERHSMQTATRRHVSSARPELGPPLAGRMDYRTHSAAAPAANLAGSNRASESAGQERSAPPVAGAANPECGSASRQSWFR